MFFKTLLLTAIGLFLGGFAAIAHASSIEPQWLRVEGNKIVNESGERVVLRGVNVMNMEWIWDSTKSIDFEKKAIAKATSAPPDGWGANIITYAVSSGPVNRGDGTYLGFLDEIVNQARANGAYIMLVYRNAEPNGDQPTMPDQAAEDAMAILAARYADEPAVIYGLQVEPHDVSWDSLKPRFISMIDAIRENNKRALIAVPGTQWGRYVHWALTDAIPRDNLIYKTHYYDPFNVVDIVYQLSLVAAKYPVILGEFGAGSMMGQSDVEQLLDLSETLGISWVGWLFHDKACPCMLVNASTFDTTSYGEEIKKRLQEAYDLSPLETINLPGRIEAEGYTRYYDTTIGNAGGEYGVDDVDIEATSDVGGGFNVGWIDNGEWLEHEVAVGDSGLYDLTVRVASYGLGTKIFHIEVDGVDVTGPMSFPTTGSWQTWIDVTASDVFLSAGTHTLRIVMDSSLFNVNYVDVVASSTASNFSIVSGDEWRYFKGVSEPPSDWRDIGFDDSGWFSGPSGFGYGDGDDATVVDGMYKSYSTLYVRRAFSVDDPSNVTSLILSMDYDDGFVAYLNGVEVARANVAGTPPKYSTLAEPEHEASHGNTDPQSVEEYDISSFIPSLSSGTNVLAIQGHNVSKYSSDFSLIPSLIGTVDEIPTPTPTPTPTPILPSTPFSFVESFLWDGVHAALIKDGKSSTVWWNQDAWDTRGDTDYNAISSKGNGNHVDIHRSALDLSDGSRVNNLLDIGGNGDPGVGVMHLDFEGIMSARLRNPMIISAESPGVVEFWASNFVTTGHWWEVSISPAGRVTGGEFTAVPSPSYKFDGNPGSGNSPSEDSINFIAIGRNDVPCKTGWEMLTGLAKSMDYGLEHLAGPTLPIDPSEKDKLYKWRLEYYRDRIDVFADMDEDGVAEQLDTFQTAIPWEEVYVNLLGVGYQADHHPQNGDCGAFQGQVRELPWKDVKISPVKYQRTAAYPKDKGTERLPQDTGWVGYDTRDTQRFGAIEILDSLLGLLGVFDQPNDEPYDRHFSLAFCSDADTYGCNDSVSKKTLSFELPKEDVIGISRAQLIYDIRKEGEASLSVNGTNVGPMPKATTVPSASSEQWVQRSIEVDPELFREGENTIIVTMDGNVQMDRLQLEFGYL